VKSLAGVALWTVIAAGISSGLPACGHPVQGKLEGRWLGEGVEGFGEEHIAAATGWSKGTSFEFSGSTMTVAIPAEEPRSGSYRVARAHQSDVYLSVVGEGGSADKVHFRLDDKHVMRWMLGNGRSILLRRQ